MFRKSRGVASVNVGRPPSLVVCFPSPGEFPTARATGNVTVVPIVKTIGLGLGLLVWGLVNLLIGWASGHFGILGVAKEPPVAAPGLNYCGVALAVLSLTVYAKITSEVAESGGEVGSGDEEGGDGAVTEPLLGRQSASQIGGRRRDGLAVAGEALALASASSPETSRTNGAGEGISRRLDTGGVYDALDHSSPGLSQHSYRLVAPNSPARSRSGSPRPFLRSPERVERAAASLVDDLYDDRADTSVKDGAGFNANAEEAAADASGSGVRRRLTMEAMEAGETDGGITAPLISSVGRPSCRQNRARWNALDSSKGRFAFGFLLSLIAGIFYGTNFNPPQHLIDAAVRRGSDAHSAEALDYVFSHFCGIFLATLSYFLMYCAGKHATGSKPELPPCILPAFVSGIMWGVAQVCWFVANAKLSFTVAFPIITSLPGLVGALWGVLVFGEIRGRSNYLLLVVSGVIRLIAVGLIALSKNGL